MAVPKLLRRALAGCEFASWASQDEHQCPLWYNQTRGELELQSEARTEFLVGSG